MRTRALCLAALLGMTTPVIMAPTPAFACGGVNHQAETPPINKVVFYTAEHPSLRCAWQWGDSMTEVQTQLLSHEEARALFNRMKKEAQAKEYFEDFQTWFAYYENGKWHAVGYYAAGQKPFSKP